MAEIVYPEESYQIIGACFEVYNELGCGFLEAVYQEALACEFKDRGIHFTEQPSLQIKYKDHLLDSTYKPDFICFNRIVLEIKAIKVIADEHRAQVHNYLKATNQKLGLLVNFGSHPKVQSERIVR